MFLRIDGDDSGRPGSGSGGPEGEFDGPGDVSGEFATVRTNSP